MFSIIVADVFERYICFDFGITVQHGAWFVYVLLLNHRPEGCYVGPGLNQIFLPFSDSIDIRLCSIVFD